MDRFLLELEKQGVPSDVASYNTVIDVVGGGGNATKMMEYFQKMKSANVKSDAHTFTAMLKHSTNDESLTKEIISQMNQSDVV